MLRFVVMHMRRALMQQHLGLDIGVDIVVVHVPLMGGCPTAHFWRA
jgi:hypothetical protein